MINVGDVFIDPFASEEGRKAYYYILRKITSRCSMAESWECLVGICDKNDAAAAYRIEDHSTEFLCSGKKVDNINVFLRAEEEHEKIKEEAKKKQEHQISLLIIVVLNYQPYHKKEQPEENRN